MPVVKQAAVEQYISVLFTNQPETVITNFLAGAQRRIERFIGYPLDYAASVVESFDIWDRTSLIQLGRRPVWSVTDVTEHGSSLAATEYVLRKDAVARTSASTNSYDRRPRLWRQGYGSVTVDYEAGYDVDTAGRETPQDLQDLIAVVAGRVFKTGAAYAATPEGAGSVKSISLDGVGSVDYGDATETSGDMSGASGSNAGDAPNLTDSEKEAAYHYVLRKVPT